LATFGTVWRSRLTGWLSHATILATACVAVLLALLPLPWAAAFVLSLLAALLVLVRPLAGLMLIVLSVPFGALFSFSLGGANIGVTEALVWLALGAWLMRMVARRRVRIAFGGVGVAIGFLLVTMLLSLSAASSLGPAVKEIVKWIEVLLLLAFVANEAREHWLEPLVATILLTGGMSAIQGVQQFVTRSGPDAFLLFGRFMRAYGSFAQPNPYAGYLGLGVAIGLGVVAAGLDAPHMHRRRAWLLLGSGTVLLMLAAIVMSWSRGAWLGMAAALGIMAIAGVLQRRSRILVVGLVLFVLCGVLHAMPGGVFDVILGRVASPFPFASLRDVRGMEVTDANFSVLERMAHWQAALAMWRGHPWLGIGIGNYAVRYSQYSLPGWDEALGHAHNYYLNVAAETGLVGMLVYFVVWVSAAIAAWRACWHLPGYQGGLALGILGALTHLGVQNIFDNLFVHGIYLQVAVLLGLLAYLRKGGH